MQQILYLIPALACPVGMGLMMWLMMRGMGGKNATGSPAPGSQFDELGSLTPEEKLAVLHARRRRLHAEIGALEEQDPQPSRN